MVKGGHWAVTMATFQVAGADADDGAGRGLAAGCYVLPSGLQLLLRQP